MSLRHQDPQQSSDLTYSGADLGHYVELLNRITDSAFNEGEHAE